MELAQDDRFTEPVCSIQHPDPVLVSSALVLFSFDVSEVNSVYEFFKNYSPAC